MPKRILRAIGRLKPWKPTRSLPSYKEPTPETRRGVSREDEAELALKHTSFAPGTPALLIMVFLLTIACVPAIQLWHDMRTRRAASWPAMFELFRVLPSSSKIAHARSIPDAWNLLPHAAELKSAERALENESVVSQWLLPIVQSFLTAKLGAGNEQVYIGRDGWLFYRSDVDYATAPSFLDPAQMRRREHAAGIAADPIKAIVQFRDQLAARGIELIVLPAPTKATIEPEKLARGGASAVAVQNAGFAEFQTRLTSARVRVCDPTPLLMERKAADPAAPLYLKTDTHWRPDTMELVATRLGASLSLPGLDRGTPLQIRPQEVSAVGDIARMLKLPPTQQLYPRETVTTREVTAGNGLWRSSPDADVLLLGDSFSNIFSLEALGWGESAGFAEHLSAALGGRPLDCILRNSDGAFATREMLANELARGRDRLAGKKLVIWEFAARELAWGNWKLLDLKLGRATASRFFSPPRGTEVEVTGTIAEVSSAPRPGSVPYKDHIVAAHLVDIDAPRRAPSEALESLVYLQSMRDNVWTPAARLRPGDRVTLKLRAWADVSAQREQINRSELDDPQLQLEEPVWGELIK